METLVSVIIPVYNVSLYLQQALDSVIHQTYKNLEILVIDDGSTDGSEVICDEYLSDPRVIVIHQENRGLSGARNTGLNHATGDYIAFLDSDDVYHPEMINLLLQSILRYNADLSVCAYTPFINSHLEKAKHKHRGVIEKEHILSAREAIISLFEGSFSTNVWSKLYRRQLWKFLRFPEGYVYEDLRVMPFLLEKCNRIATLPQILVYHRLRKESISHTDTKKNLEDNISAFQTALAYANTIQPSLPPEIITIYREKRLRSLIFKHETLYRSKAFLNLPGFENILLEEIQNLSGNEPVFLQKRTKIVWWLHNHYSSALIPTQACFLLVKQLFKKCK